MTKIPDNLLEQIYDITGLDGIGWWPLAPGWWALIAVVLTTGGILYWRHLAYQRSWKGDAWRRLKALDAQLQGGDPKDSVAILSALMRRIAIRRYARADCAGLEGQNWLHWLAEKDPRRFDWARKGGLLIETPYAPPGRPVSPAEIAILVAAAKQWVR